MVTEPLHGALACGQAAHLQGLSAKTYCQADARPWQIKLTKCLLKHDNQVSTVKRQGTFMLQ
jgi:hypothetical protein